MTGPANLLAGRNGGTLRMPRGTMADAKTIYQVAAILDCIDYKDWQFRLMPKGDGFLLQAVWMAPDASNFHGEPKEQVSRKWYISPYACEREIIDTAYGLVERAEIHEAQEFFRYRGEPIFNRHIRPEALLEVAKNVQTRESE